MIRRFTTITAILSTAALMAAGGIALAQGTSHKKVTHHAAKHASRASHASETTGVDTDSVQSGDQTTPDAVASPASAGEEQSSELAGNDGPGGHEDEAGAEVDHQFEGEE
jgi:N-acetylmuramoyl-L-alanine amidase CwlA